MDAEDGRRARGDASRRAVTAAAVDLASLYGIERLSFGGLAENTPLSKGGIAALFATKAQLQLATVAAAVEIFKDHVIAPARTAPRGLARLRALAVAWITYSEQRVFAGGCFFAAVGAELGPTESPLRDAVAEAIRSWNEYVIANIESAVEAGELSRSVDAGQMAFELSSLLYGANSASLLSGSSEPYARARLAVTRLFDAYITTG